MTGVVLSGSSSTGGRCWNDEFHTRGPVVIVVVDTWKIFTSESPGSDLVDLVLDVKLFYEPTVYRVSNLSMTDTHDARMSN